ncbi:MAG TPA: DUF6428 family protein [Opitutaceae bacterium]
MYLSQLKQELERSADNTLSVVLPDGRRIPADFHVTEVGHVVRNFVDCGGTVRSVQSCLLQVWLARNDKDHRLTAGKLASILDLAKSVVPSAEIEVEFEYAEGAVSQYRVASVVAGKETSTITLANKQTDCLAREACGLESGCCS